MLAEDEVPAGEPDREVQAERPAESTQDSRQDE
jgi:hypothetical protein